MPGAGFGAGTFGAAPKRPPIATPPPAYGNTPPPPNPSAPQTQTISHLTAQQVKAMFPGKRFLPSGYFNANGDGTMIPVPADYTRPAGGGPPPPSMPGQMPTAPPPMKTAYPQSQPFGVGPGGGGGGFQMPGGFPPIPGTPGGQPTKPPGMTPWEWEAQQKNNPTTTGYQPPPSNLNNTAQNDPQLAELYQMWKGRMGADTTKRAQDRSTASIMDAAALGAADLRGGNLARRGLVGSGAGDTFLQKRVFAPAQREAAGKAADIALGRERDLDAMVMGGLGIAGAQGNANRADRALALQQYLGEQGNALGWAGLNQNSYDSDMARWMALLQNQDMFPPGPSGGGGPGIGSVGGGYKF